MQQISKDELEVLDCVDRRNMQINSHGFIFKTLACHQNSTLPPSLPPTQPAHPQKKRKEMKVKMWKPSESHRGGGVMNVTCYWSTFIISGLPILKYCEPLENSTNVFWAVFIKMHALFVSYKGTKRQWQQCCDATQRKVSDILIS